MRGSGGTNRITDPDQMTIARERQRFSDDAKALHDATQAFKAREKEYLRQIAQLEKENRALRSENALSLVSRTNTLPAGSYRETLGAGIPLNLPRMASRNRIRAGEAPPPRGRSGAAPKVQGRSRAAS